jgi:hypothetical protein
VPASLEQDRHEATDLVIFRARDVTIACRIRRPQYACYGSQFTLRLHRDNGVPTEFEKIIDGWGDWMFYGYATGHGLGINPWWLLDLSAFRSHLMRDESREVIQYDDIPNYDGTSFRAYHIMTFPPHPRLVIAQCVFVSSHLFDLPEDGSALA